MVAMVDINGEMQMADPSSPMLYWIGGAVSSTIPDFLTSCDPGKEWDDSTGSCKICANGFFSLGGSRVFLHTMSSRHH